MLMTNTLDLRVHPREGLGYDVNFTVSRLGCSRYAARDVESTSKMLEKVRSDGYSIHEGRGSGICFKSRYLLTNEDAIEVQGQQTSGEVEFVAIRHADEILISVGSDHNDRSLEKMWTAMLGKIFDTAKSKQMVPAVIAKDAWLYRDIKDHWDQIVVKSFVTVSNEKKLYQQLSLRDMLHMDYYLDKTKWFVENGSVLFGGSGGMSTDLPGILYQGQSTVQDVIFPSDFYFEMYDPVLGRTINHGYEVIPLEDPESKSL